MKKHLLTFTVLILTLALSTKTNAQPDSGGFSIGPEASQVEPGFAPSETKIGLTNYPNPVKNNTTIQYSIPADGVVLLKVYNSAGKQVTTIAQGYKTAGTYQIQFNASNMSGGIYVCRLSVIAEKGSITAMRVLKVSK